MHKKVNLFLIGAAKAGTTSLQTYLNQHPDIFFSPLKEPNYFAKDINPNTFSSAYKKRNVFVSEAYFKLSPLPDHHISFVQSLENYEMLFMDAKHQTYLGDASTSYLYSAAASAEIYNYNPDAKLLVIIRNPIERAYSHYKMAVQGGYTDLDFRQAIESDLNQLNKGFGISELFIELGMYSNQLKRYYDSFSPDQIKVLFYEDFNSDPEKEIKSILNWLILDEVALNIDEQKNISMQPKSKKWNKVLSDTGIKQLASSLFPNSIKEKIKNRYYSTSIDTISKDDYLYLLSIYKEDIKKTEELLQTNLSHWYNV